MTPVRFQEKGATPSAVPGTISSDRLAIHTAFRAGYNATEVKNLLDLSDEDLANYFRCRRAGFLPVEWKAKLTEQGASYHFRNGATTRFRYSPASLTIRSSAANR